MTNMPQPFVWSVLGCKSILAAQKNSCAELSEQIPSFRVKKVGIHAEHLGESKDLVFVGMGMGFYEIPRGYP